MDETSFKLKTSIYGSGCHYTQIIHTEPLHCEIRCEYNRKRYPENTGTHTHVKTH